MDQPTGRELDAAIAQHVFGYEVEPRVNARTRETDYVQRTPSGDDWVRVAFYSAGDAAINVAVELQNRGWTRRMPLVKEHGEVTVVLEHTDGRTVEAFGR
ncbi:MAG TPA: hypothetical protein VF819_10430 [Nitrospira sp.]